MKNESSWPRVGVGAVIVQNKKILLVERAAPPAAGMWAVPGGKVNPGERLQVALKREIFEETGFHIRVGEMAHVFDVSGGSPDEDDFYHYVIIDFFARIESGELKPGDDARDAGWFSLDDNDNPAIHIETRRLMKNLADKNGQ